MLRLMPKMGSVWLLFDLNWRKKAAQYQPGGYNCWITMQEHSWFFHECSTETSGTKQWSSVSPKCHLARENACHQCHSVSSKNNNSARHWENGGEEMIAWDQLLGRLEKQITRSSAPCWTCYFKSQFFNSTRFFFLYDRMLTTYFECTTTNSFLINNIR